MPVGLKSGAWKSIEANHKHPESESIETKLYYTLQIAPQGKSH